MWAGFRVYLLTSRVCKKKNNFIVKVRGKHHLNQVIDVNITSNKLYYYHVPPDKTRAHHLPDSLWKEFITSVYSWENIRQTYVEGHSPEYLSTTCQGDKRQGKTKKLSCFEETKEMCKLNAMRHPGLVLGTEKNINEKIGDIWINYFSWWYLPMLIF